MTRRADASIDKPHAQSGARMCRWAHFTHRFRQAFGVTPAAIRKALKL